MFTARPSHDGTRGKGEPREGGKRQGDEENIRRALNFLAAKKRGTRTLFGGLPSFLLFVLPNKGWGGLLVLRFFFTEHVEVYFYYAERERKRERVCCATRTIIRQRGYCSLWRHVRTC